MNLVSVGTDAPLTARATYWFKSFSQTLQNFIKRKMQHLVFVFKGDGFLLKCANAQKCARKGIFQNTANEFRRGERTNQKSRRIYFVEYQTFATKYRFFFDTV